MTNSNDARSCYGQVGVEQHPHDGGLQAAAAYRVRLDARTHSPTLKRSNNTIGLPMKPPVAS